MRRHDRWVVSTIIAAGLTASGLSGGAALAAGEGPAPAAKAGAPAKLEQIPGSELYRVILTPKAAERIALETGVVAEEPVDRWLLVSGEVETIATPPAGAVAAHPAIAGQSSDAAATIPLLTPAPPTAAGPKPAGIVPVRVRVPAINPPEQAQVQAQATPVLVLEDDDDDDRDEADDDLDDASVVVIIRPDGDGAAALKAKPVQVASSNDEARYYELINGGSADLRPGQDVQVRVPHPDNGSPKKVIPLSAVIYSADGKAWTYTVAEPLTFIRHAIEIDYVARGRAVLKEGPAAGTPIVTRGAAELWGVETKNG